LCSAIVVVASNVVSPESIEPSSSSSTSYLDTGFGTNDDELATASSCFFLSDLNSTGASFDFPRRLISLTFASCCLLFSSNCILCFSNSFRAFLPLNCASNFSLLFLFS